MWYKGVRIQEKKHGVSFAARLYLPVRHHLARQLAKHKTEMLGPVLERLEQAVQPTKWHAEQVFRV